MLRSPAHLLLGCPLVQHLFTSLPCTLSCAVWAQTTRACAASVCSHPGVHTARSISSFNPHPLQSQERGSICCQSVPPVEIHADKPEQNEHTLPRTLWTLAQHLGQASAACFATGRGSEGIAFVSERPFWGTIAIPVAWLRSCTSAVTLKHSLKLLLSPVVLLSASCTFAEKHHFCICCEAPFLSCTCPPCLPLFGLVHFGPTLRPEGCSHSDSCLAPCATCKWRVGAAPRTSGWVPEVVLL